MIVPARNLHLWLGFSMVMLNNQRVNQIQRLIIPHPFPTVAIYNRLKLFFLEPASYAFIFKIFCLAWSRRPREYFCSDQMHLEPLGHSSHVDMGGFKIWPTTSHHPFPHPNWHSSPKLDPEIHGISSQIRIPSLTKHGHKFPFPSIEASACLRTSLPVPGFGGRSRW